MYHLILVVSLGLFLTSCADDLTENLAVQNVPLSVQVMEELNSLDPLKSYKTASNMSPNFRLGAALKASDLAAGGNVSALAAANFDEVVDAGIMQYAACVSDDGTMTFSNVEDFVATAQKVGVGVYGQSLIWHGQQRPKYIQALFDNRGREIKEQKQKEKEKEKEESGQQTLPTQIVYEPVACENEDLTKLTEFPYYVMGYTPEFDAEKGLLSVSPGDWYQYFIADHIPTEAGESYAIEVVIKGEGTGSFNANMGWGWGEGESTSTTVKFTEEWETVRFDFAGPVNGTSCNVVFQPGGLATTFYVRSIKVLHKTEQTGPIATTVYDDDLTQTASFPWYVMGYTPEYDAVHGLNSVSPGDWYQYFIADHITTVAGDKYAIEVEIKGEGTGSFNANMGWGWGEGESTSTTVKFTDAWTTERFDFAGPVGGTSCNVVFQPGALETTFYVRRIKVIHYETPAIESDEDEPESLWKNMVVNSDLEGDDLSAFVAKISPDAAATANVVAGEGVDGSKCIKLTVPPVVTNDYESQLWFSTPDFYPEGTVIKVSFDYKADKEAKVATQAHGDPGGDHYNHYAFAGDVNFTTEWQHFEKTVTLDGDMAKTDNGGFRSCTFNLSVAEQTTYYFDNLKMEIEEKIPAGEISSDEKVAILTKAMSEWIEGIMGAAGSSVQAWTVINEPIAESGDDGNGNYPLQHADAPNSNGNDAGETYFWQDLLGDVEYARMAVADARKAYKGNASDLLLFVNDYNLNNDADDNKKCKSLIAWIAKWEADGKTKIDGIGTELHLTCYEDAASNTKKQAAITKMFELLAASKKLVRVSALDIDFQNKSGKTLQVHELTDEQQQQMADLYKFVIKTYLEKVPSAQQYGICKWSIIDSGNQPKGLWTDQFRRKLTFKGFAEGLSGK